MRDQEVLDSAGKRVMVIVETTYDIFTLVGGPYHGRVILRTTTMPVCAAHCEGDDGLVHVYAPAGSSLVYTDVYQKISFAEPAPYAVSGM